MQDSQNKILGRLVLRRALMSEDTARRCLEESTRQGQSFLAVASAHRLLTPEQSQQIWAEYQSYQSAWSNHQSTVQGSRTLPVGQPIPSGSGSNNSSKGSRESKADKDGLPGIGDSIDGYEVIKLLGKGGMGAVYRVRKDSKDYALKVILTENDTALARFEREAQAAAAVDTHENIVRIYRYAQYQGRWYILSDFVKGCGLDEFLVEGEPMELERSLEIMAKVASAVDFIHEKGILHRDLKPANILIRGDDHEPLITDFGLARLADSETLTKSQDFLGTPAYMAPEQAGSEHKAVGPASDIWALGAILYQLSTGQRPFVGESAVELITKILMGDPESPTSLNPDLPRDVETIIDKALQKEIPDRYARAGDMAKDCLAVLHGEPIVAKRMGPIGKFRRQLKRRFGRALPLVLASLLLIGLGLPAALWYRNQLVEKERIQSENEQRVRELRRSLKKLQKGSLQILLSADLLNSQGTDWKKARGEFEALKGQLKDLELKGDPQFLSQSKEYKRSKEFIDFLNELSAKKRKNVQSAPLKTYLKARDQFKKELFGEARKGFVKLTKKGAELKLMAWFALGLTELRSDSWKDAQLAFYELESDQYLSDLGSQTLRAFFEETVLEMLLKTKKTHALNKKRETELFRAFQAAMNKSTQSRDVWESWNKRLEEDFFGRAKSAGWSLKDTVSRWKTLSKKQSVESGFRPPQLNKEMLRVLAEEAKTKGEALRYYLKARQLDKNYLLPKGFRPSEIAGEIMSLLLVDSDRKIEEAFQFMMVASRSGIYVPVTRKIALPKFEEKGYFHRLYQEDPDDPLLHYWRGLIPPQYYQDKQSLSKKQKVAKLERINKDLSLAIQSEKLPGYYRAVALEKRVKVQQIIREYLEKPPAEPVERWSRDLEQALVLQHPKPQLIYLQFWGWCRDKDKKIEWARKRVGAIKDRRQRTATESLGQGRPWECPIEILDEGSYKNQAMDAHIKLAETYQDFEMMDEAIDAARLGYSFKPASGYALTRYGEMLLRDKRAEQFEKLYLNFKRNYGLRNDLKAQFDHFLKNRAKYTK